MPSQLFTQNTKWLCPAGVNQLLVECWGGGGAGGGVTARNSTGGGGAGGAYAKKNLAVIPGQQYDIIIGYGGIGAYSTGSPGGASYFESPAIVYAEGGNGGGGTSVDYVNSSPALGSLNSSLGDLIRKGGNGSYGDFSRYFSGAGGGGAGALSNGGNANNNIGGKGTSPYGGDGANGTFTYDDGLPGNVYGAGGSGGIISGKNTGQDSARVGYVIGGDGAQGVVLLTYELGSNVDLGTSFKNESSLFLVDLTVFTSFGFNVKFVNLPSQLLINLSTGQPIDSDIKIANIKITSQGIVKHWWKLNYPFQN